MKTFFKSHLLYNNFNSRFFYILLLIFHSLFIYAQSDSKVELVIQNGHHDIITDLTFNHDGTKLASSSEDNSIIVWDVTTGKEFIMLKEHSHGVNSVVFSPDSEVLVSGGGINDHQLIFWDWKKGVVKRKIQEAAKTSISSLAYSPDGKLLISCAYREIRMWNAETTTLKFKIGGQKLPYADLPIKGNIKTVSFSPDGKNFAIGIDNGEVQIRNSDNGNLLQSLNVKSHDGKILTLSFSADGQILYTGGSTDNIITWDIMLTQVKNFFESISLEYPCPCDISADNNQFATLCNGMLKIQNLENGSRVFTKRTGLFENQAIAYHPEKSNFIAVSGVNIKNKNVIKLIDIKTGHTLRVLKGYKSGIASIAFSPDGSLLASGAKNQKLKIWDLKSGLGYSNYTEKEKHLRTNFATVRFSIDGKKVYKATEKDFIGWDVLSKKRDFSITNRGKEPNSFALQKSNEFATLINNGIKVFDFSKNTFVNGVKGPRLKTRCLAINDSENWLYSGGYKEIKRWDIENMESLPAFIIPDYAWEIVFKPNDQFFATREKETEVVIRKSDTGTYIHTLTSHGKNITFNKQGNVIATSYSDTLYIWDSNNYRLIHKLGGHQDEINCIAFNPTKEIVATGGEDSSIKLWNYSKGELIATLIATNENDFTIITPENYFMTSNYGAKSAVLRKGEQVFPLEIYDLIYNRPDTVLETLGLTPNNLIELYKKDYLERNTKKLLDVKKFSVNYHLPSLKIIGHAPPLTSEDRLVSFKIMASDKESKLDRLHVLVNNIPVYGAQGRKIKTNAYHTKTTLESIEIKLSDGTNKIEFYVQNENGVLSLKENYEILYVGHEHKRKLHIVTIGGSKFNDQNYNLSSSTNELKVFSELFRDSDIKYDEIKNYQFIDERAILLNIENLKSVLRSTGLNDHIFVLISGMGLLDQELNYYIGTHDVNFNSPAQKGVSLKTLEYLLEEIPSRNVVVFFNLYHLAKNTDKPVDTLSNNVEVKQFNNGKIKPKVDFRYSVDIIKKTLADISKNTGVKVVPFVGEAEYIVDGSNEHSSVFIHSLMKAVTEKNADINNDNKITISELKRFLIDNIRELTENKSKFAGYIENEEIDFQIW